MELNIKQLKQGSQIIVPQTTAEAVLVKQGENTVRLDQALDSKSNIIITPSGSGLINYSQGNTIILTHSNNISPNETLKPLSIKYDSHGHIVESSEVHPLKISVNSTEYMSHTGIEENTLQLGDDFTTDNNNNIKLNWDEI